MPVLPPRPTIPGEPREPVPFSEPPSRPQVSPAARDRQLVRAAALGDEAAWEALVDEHAQAVWDVARAAHLRTEEAAAVCEVVWRMLAAHLPATEGLPIAVWLRRTAASESHLAYLRAHSRTTGERRRHDRRKSS